MLYTRLGATGLRVSRLAIGTMTFGDRVPEKDAHKIMDWARDAGVTMLDTANAYVGGASEEIIGRWMKKRGGRGKVTLASKVRSPVGTDWDTASLSPAVVIREVEASLKRLQTDYLDVLYLHQPDDDTPIEITLRAVETLVDQGKVRYLGLSNYAAWQVTDALHRSRKKGWIQPTVLQPMYNPVARGIDEELLPMARHFDLGICAYNPLAGGLLTGKHKPGGEAAKGSRLESNAMYRKRYWNDSLRHAAEELATVAADNGRTVIELALRFMLDTPQLHVALIGGTSLKQFEENAKACDAKPLSVQERAACDAIWATLRGEIPRYQRTNADLKRPD